jgi:hypothetical protein
MIVFKFLGLNFEGGGPQALAREEGEQPLPQVLVVIKGTEREMFPAVQ